MGGVSSATMNRHVFLLLISLLAFRAITNARQTSVTPSPVTKEKTALLERLAQTRPDTGRVHALYALARSYWYGKEVNYDSVEIYSSRAFTLAKQIKYELGIHESANFLCKAYVKKGAYDKARGLLPQVSAVEQSRLLILIGEGFLYQPDLRKPALDSAFRYFSQALQNAQSTGSVHWKHESLIALGKYYYSADQLQKGKDAFLTIIHDLQQTKEVSKEAHIWSEMGTYMPDTDSTYQDNILVHTKAMQLYTQLKDTPNIYSELQSIAVVHMFHSKFDTAEVQLLKVLELRIRSGSKKIAHTTRALGWLKFATGDLTEALRWAIVTEQNEQEFGLYSASNQVLLGLIYMEDHQYEKALSYLLGTKDYSGDYPWFIAQKVAEIYIRVRQPEKALAYMLDFETSHPPKSPLQHETIAAAKGDIYTALNRPGLAESYYLLMIGLDKQAQQFKSREIFPMPFSVAGAEAYAKIASFYVNQGRYQAATPYVTAATRANSFSGSQFYLANNRRDIRWLQYKLDSAAGNYQAALVHHVQYTRLKDSISDATLIRQFHQLQVANDIEKKDSAINQQDRLIKTMDETDRLRQHNLEQANLLRNISIGATIVFLVLAVLFYRQYRQKRHANQLVTTQNDQLQHLLKEKEWLLKEVHHRVKNNLHTIISLLESQAIFLENDALKAIESSQHRIYAMSLIHQKLYQVDNVKNIEMGQYLPEFIQYLKQSFGTSNKILFRTEIESLSLDVSVAIPIALILNEAVTNSIKYAFPGNRKGTILVAMYRSGEEVVLEVADDGIGIDKNIINNTLNSLGVELMKGLSEDINGRIEFANDGGTKITVRFSADSPFYPTMHLNKEKENLS
jgi:two-component system, sensor histidine kinase PdtaS